MKRTFVTLYIAFLLGTTAYAQTEAQMFILVTTAYKWPDGLASSVGEVERVVSSDAKNYMLWTPTGIEYPLPKHCAQVITPEQAALRLLAQRRQLYSQLSATSTQLQQYQQYVQQIQAAQKAQTAQQARQLQQRSSVQQMQDYMNLMKSVDSLEANQR